MIFSNIVCKKSSNKASRETLETSDIDQYLNLMNFVKQNSNERKLVKSSDIALQKHDFKSAFPDIKEVDRSTYNDRSTHNHSVLQRPNPLASTNYGANANPLANTVAT